MQKYISHSRISVLKCTFFELEDLDKSQVKKLGVNFTNIDTVVTAVITDIIETVPSDGLLNTECNKSPERAFQSVLDRVIITPHIVTAYDTAVKIMRLFFYNRHKLHALLRQSFVDEQFMNRRTKHRFNSKRKREGCY